MRADFVRKLGQAVSAMSAAVIVYATLRPNLSTDIADDSLLHFMLFFPLGMGGALWMAQLDPTLQKKARLGILIVALFFAAATEIAQGPIEGRTPSLSDFFADAAGAGLGLLAGGWVASRARRSGN
ncbi:MAG: VanZ family protein [Dehalococcoidia bacterium]|nr:VanZ family protein [Dehalococcoidia bacterium]MCB9482680.1 VanZ family protein [Dehalococcoidia bacterium]